MGRSLPKTSDGKIRIDQVQVNDQPWKVYAVGGTPAQAVLHAVLEILPQKPDLLVSGINFGENIGTSITISGTVGAALEGAALGIPSLAISLETDTQASLRPFGCGRFLGCGHFYNLFWTDAVGKTPAGGCGCAESGYPLRRHVGYALGDHACLAPELF